MKEIVPSLLPSQKTLQLNSWELDETATHITVHASSIQNPVRCPVCSAISHRVHSQYERTINDLSWANFRVTLQLDVRKFFCKNPYCQRRIFAERITDIAAAWAPDRLGFQIRVASRGAFRTLCHLPSSSIAKLVKE